MGIVKTDPINSIEEAITARKKLIAKYDVNDPKGVDGNTLVDLSGNGNDGIMTNVEIVEDSQLGRKVLYFNNDPSARGTSFITFKTTIIPLRHYIKTKMRPSFESKMMVLCRTCNMNYNSGEYGMGIVISSTTSGGLYGIQYSTYYKKSGSAPGDFTIVTRNIPQGGNTWVPIDIVDNAIIDEKIIIRSLNGDIAERIATKDFVYKGSTQRFTLGVPYNTTESNYGYKGYLDTFEIYDLEVPLIHLICDNKNKLYTIQSGELVTLNITLDSPNEEIKMAIESKGFKDTAELLLLMKSPSWDMSKFSLVSYDVVG